MPSLGLEKHVVDQKVYENSLERFAKQKILLPTFAQLAEPATIPTRRFPPSWDKPSRVLAVTC